jgi:hypothetical protein
MRYIPSPITPQFAVVYSAMANKSGRMQYHKAKPGLNRLRISRGEFIKAFNSSRIVAVKPLQVTGNAVDFQIEFYV